MNRRKFDLTCSFGILLAVATMFHAISIDAAESLRGFPKKFSASVGLCSPAVGDVDGDKSPDIVLAVGAELTVLTAEGEPNFAVPMNGGSLSASPTLADLDGDGVMEVIVGDKIGKLHVFSRGATELEGFPKKLRGSIESAALATDLNGDGSVEIAVGTKAGFIYLIDRTGGILQGFPKNLHSPIKGGMAAGDLTGDGNQDLVVPTESGAVYALSAKGKILKGWPRKAKFEVSGGVSLGDIDDDGMFEVVFGSQDFKLYAFNGDGTSVKGFPIKTSYRIYGAPALADLNGDDVTDVVVAIGDGRVWALDGKGRMLKGWPRRIGKRIGGGAVVADLDNDGDLEVIAASSDAGLAVFHHNGRRMAGFPVHLGGATYATPTVTDLDRDGARDILVGTVEKELYCFRIPPEDKEGVAPPAWPTMGRDMARIARTYPNPPRYKDLRILPKEPGTNDTLKVDYVYFDLDGEPEANTKIRWYLNGKHEESLDGSREVKPERTKKGQRWTVEVQDEANFKRFGRKGKGAKVYRSKSVRIKNSPPGSPRIAITPEEPKTGDDLEVKILHDSPDADGDKVHYTFRWIRNHKPVRLPSRSRKVPARMTRKGERWMVVVIPFDGKNEGPPARAEVTIGNTPPGPSVVKLSPARPRTVDEIKVVVKKPARDPDGDPVRYKAVWFVRDKQVPSTPTSLRLAPGFARKGDVVVAKVTSMDGKDEGGVAEAETKVGNSRPRPPKVVVMPRSPRTGDDLKAYLTDEGKDDDGDRLSYKYKWFKNGRFEKDLDTATVPAKMTERGQRWTVEVRSFDGESESKPAKAEAVIGNTPPPAPVVAWKGDGAKTTDDLEVRVVQASKDPDGDKVTLSYEWFRNGKSVQDVQGHVLDSARTRKGECWTVEVTPSDGRDQGTPSRLSRCIVDSAPASPEIVITPASPFTDDDITCSVKSPSKDPDGDRVKYEFSWFKNGELFALPPQSGKRRNKSRRKGLKPVFSSVLKAAYTTKGDHWSCEVVPYDGELHGPVARAETKVVDTPPERPEIAIEPSRPVTGQRLVLKFAKRSKDSDGDGVLYSIKWFKNGVEVKELAGRADVPPRMVKKGDVWAVEVVPDDGENKGKAARAEAKVINSRPEPPVVALNPERPKTTDDVKLVIKKPASDPDGDEVKLEYSWWLNGKPYTQEEKDDPALLHSSETKAGQKWRAEVRAFDGDSRSVPAVVWFEISNTPPVKPAVEITPKAPVTADNLSCRVTKESADPDHDKLTYSFTWLKDGVIVKGSRYVKAGTVNTKATGKGQVWTCRVTPFDGKDRGEPVQVSVKIGNTAPVPPKIALEPSTPTTLDEPKCMVRKQAVDADNDKLETTFTWLRNGKVVPISPAMSKLPKGVLKEGEHWKCEVHVFDGEAKVVSRSQEVVVGNAPPGMPGVVVEPAEPDTLDDLHCFLSTPAADPDLDLVEYVYSWYLNGKAVPGLKGKDTVPGSMTRKKQRWTCEVRAKDDQGVLGRAGTAGVVIGNAAPGEARISIEPAEPTAGHPLRCVVVSKSTDPDGDRVKYEFEWFKDGVSRPEFKGKARLPGQAVKKSDIWRCEAVPTDGAARGKKAVSQDVIVR